MTFIDFLKLQAKRKDEGGWLARLLLSSSISIEKISSFCGKESLSKYASTLPVGKIRRSLIDLTDDWVKSASRPRVGIYWIVNNEVVDFSADVNEIPFIAGFKDGPYDHVGKWTQMVSLYPQLKKLEYFDIPRGRIIGAQDRRYRLFISPDDKNNSPMINKIIKVFSLPKNSVDIVADEHYQIDSEIDPFD